MYDEEIFLISNIDTGEKDNYGDSVFKEIKEKRYAEIKSVSQSEFYQAQTAGMKPEIKIELSDFTDYEGQKEVVYGEYRYKVLRTYKTKRNSMELVLYGGVRNVSA